MARGVGIQGGVGQPIVGVLRPDEVTGGQEAWAPEGGSGLLAEVNARLGSEDDARKVVLAVLAPLRGWLDGPPLEAVLATLPYGLAHEIRDAERVLLAPVAPVHGSGDYLVLVAGVLQHAVPVAREYVLAVLRALRRALPPEDVSLVSERLAGSLASLWASAVDA